MIVPLPLELPEDIASFVTAALGSVTVDRAFTQDHGYSRLWRVLTRDGAYWVKSHGRLAKARGEGFALDSWSHPLMPALVARTEDPNVLVMTERPGRCAEEVELDEAARLRMWREAGTFLASLHARSHEGFGEAGSPFGTDPVAWFRHAFGRRAGLAVTSGLVIGPAADLVIRALEEAPGVAGNRPVAAHRDFSPRNWLVAPDGALTGVIDFEHSRWDLAAIDLCRSWDREWTDDPATESAFYEGYGARPSDECLRTVRTAQAAAAIQWCVEYGIADYEARNRAALNRLAAGS